jgi:hypothetical protein
MFAPTETVLASDLFGVSDHIDLSVAASLVLLEGERDT